MKVLVTGGKGQLGWKLAQFLEAAGIPYVAPGRDELDVTDGKALLAAIDGKTDGFPITTVIHAAAFTKVDLCETEVERAFAVNAIATERLARLCAERGIPLVYVGTDFVFNGDKNSPYEVDDPPAPLSVYGVSKLAGEEAVRRLAERYYIVRTAWLFGPYGHNFPRAILGAAASGKPLRVVDDQVGSPTYVRDLAEAVLDLLGIAVIPEGIHRTHPVVGPAPYGMYHVTNSGSCSWFGFAKEILNQAGWRLDVERISSAQLARPARRPAYSVLSLASMEARGLHLRPWQEALSDFLRRLRPIAPELFPGERGREGGRR